MVPTLWKKSLVRSLDKVPLLLKVLGKIVNKQVFAYHLYKVILVNTIHQCYELTSSGSKLHSVSMRFQVPNF